MRIDLDLNATTRTDARVREAMARALEVHGNPSSIHEEGRRARDLVERARDDVARLIGAEAREIVFTSGGTEADVLGVVGAARAARAAGRPARVVTSPLEHPAVKGAVSWLAREGFEVVEVPVSREGRIDPDDVARAAGAGAAILAFALANHELGNVYAVGSWSRGGVALHCDAVQAVGKLPVSVAELGVDLLALSGHKIHGPKGVGALWVRRGVALEPLWSGHQERGLRPGTENVAGIVGLGMAARLAREEGPGSWPRITALRDRLEAGVLAIAGARLYGDREGRVGNTSNVAFAGAAGDLVVQALDLEGVAVSTGAACTSGSVEPSPVVRALGVPRAEAAEAVRFSLGKETTAAEVERVAALLPEIIARIRAA